MIVTLSLYDFYCYYLSFFLSFFLSTLPNTYSFINPTIYSDFFPSSSVVEVERAVDLYTFVLSTQFLLLPVQRLSSLQSPDKRQNNIAVSRHAVNYS
jgi:hypothetical protein